MNNPGLHINKSGTLQQPKSPSAKTIKALAQARDSFARVVAGGIVLGVLSVAYLIALFKGLDGASNILVVIGSGLGFLLGGGRDGKGGSDD